LVYVGLSLIHDSEIMGSGGGNCLFVSFGRCRSRVKSVLACICCLLDGIRAIFLKYVAGRLSG